MAAKLVLVLQLSVCLSYHFGIVATEEPPRGTQDSGSAAGHDVPAPDSFTRDTLTSRMFKLYDKYSRELNRPRDGNTVRSFRATPDGGKEKDLFHFNMTFVQDSEVILSAAFHFFFDYRPWQRSWLCKRSQSPACHVPVLQQMAPVRVLFWSQSRDGADGMLLGNVTFMPPRRGAWLTRDISDIVKQAQATEEPLIMVEFDFSRKYLRRTERLSSLALPYLLVFAEDLSISEPNSVASSLQRYGPFPGAEEPARSPNAYPKSRVRRDARSSDPIRNNELPEVEHGTWKNHKMWESSYLAPKPKVPQKEHRRRDPEGGLDPGAPQVLSFDEETMRKARRRQWSEPRVCARRYLRVDFTDIGWSEWILAPKAFDAYYCAGTCGFPMPKVVRPSNHATIQSIVRAVGITPGVPEPCCVPEQMGALSVLFLDESRNMILKVYPSMSVETCSCR
ncbi:growth/differentiation factor 10-like isoform X1 [Paramormyrops kingsleyae]|uniref:Growth/differentiation factor 10 n=1 Tax=Paramormyrops kingsleyae TaxID=1676925 RepID=A0A3B3T8Q4_9TELE|nr:growth/differentiation factor 10-like isoform X1 [Paramormyrops kingsleyae]